MSGLKKINMRVCKTNRTVGVFLTRWTVWISWCRNLSQLHSPVFVTLTVCYDVTLLLVLLLLLLLLVWVNSSQWLWHRESSPGCLLFDWMRCHILVLLFSNKVNIWLIHVSRASFVCQDGPAESSSAGHKLFYCTSRFPSVFTAFGGSRSPSHLLTCLWLANMSHWPVQLWVLEITCFTGCCVLWCLPCCRELVDVELMRRSLRQLQWLCWTAVTLVNVTQLRPRIFSVHWKQRIGERRADVSHWREMNSLSCTWLLPVLLLCFFLNFFLV